MNRMTKTLGSTTGFLAAAAFSGLIAGTTNFAAASTTSAVRTGSARVVVDGKAGVKARNMDGATHDCKGKNDCKGQGGCSSGDGGCKGKNSCKGKGGCSTASSTTKKSM